MNSKQQILLNKIEYLFKFFYIVGVLVVLALLDDAGKDYIISSFKRKKPSLRGNAIKLSQPPSSLSEGIFLRFFATLENDGEKCRSEGSRGWHFLNLITLFSGGRLF